MPGVVNGRTLLGSLVGCAKKDPLFSSRHLGAEIMDVKKMTLILIIHFLTLIYYLVFEMIILFTIVVCLNFKLLQYFN